MARLFGFLIQTIFVAVISGVLFWQLSDLFPAFGFYGGAMLGVLVSAVYELLLAPRGHAAP